MSIGLSLEFCPLGSIGFFLDMNKVDRAAGLAAGFGAGFGAEKMGRVGRAAAFFRAGVETDFGAAFEAEKMYRVDRAAAFLGAGVGATLGAAAVLGVPKNEKG